MWHIIPPLSILSLSPQAEIKFFTFEDWITNRKNNGNAEGADYYFYSDGTFKIRNWFYGESIGFRALYITGQYCYNPTINEFKLTSTEPKLKEDILLKHPLHTYLTIFLKIIDKTDNIVTVEGYAYNNGKKISFGKSNFVQKSVAEYEEMLIEYDKRNAKQGKIENASR